jgi:regulatory protein SWI5
MLSNPHSNLQRQQRQHRRQNSTPIAFEAPKVPLLPATKLQRLAFHRRGQSLDQRVQQQPFPDGSTVSIPPGFQPNPQHSLQEAQQHRLVQPGQQQERFSFPARNFEAWHQEDTDAYFKQSVYYDTLFGQPVDGVNTTNSQISRDGVKNSGNEKPTYLDHSAVRTALQASYPGGFGLGLDEFPGFYGNGASEGHLLLNMHLSGPANCDSRPVNMHKDWEECQQRPSTPLKQASSGKPYPQGCWIGEGFMMETAYYPLTPTKTPHSLVPQTAIPRRKTEVSSPSLNTVKAPPRTHGHRRAQSTRDVFFGNRFGDDTQGLPSPPNSAPLPAGAFDIAPIPHPSFMSMKSLNVDFNGSDNGYESSHYSPMSSALSPALSSPRSSVEPEISRIPLFNGSLDSAPNLEMPADIYSVPSSSNGDGLVFPEEPQKAENQPFSSTSKSASMLDLNIDASIKDTGITIDDIASFIQGPDPLDGKWMCLYPDCNKRFGRKENIKSHIQTHLGDRQFICNHCNKCFVRQHDLKRHSKIHSGVKPYPCLCGNSFARHDALTRHRQRGMCIGAFEGIIKKAVKRGRPRKTRPDEEERLDKAARTRKAVAMSATSSSSGFSERSNPHSPPGGQDPGTEIPGPFDGLPEYLPNSDRSSGVSPDIFSCTPPTSPQLELKSYVSPQHTQLSPTYHSPSPMISPMRIPTTSASRKNSPLPSSLPSPGQGFEDVYTTPPELSHLSSSPPPSAVSSKYDLDTFSERHSNEGSPADGHQGKVDPSNFTLPGIGEEDEMFSSCISTLERDPSVLLMPEFDKLFSSNDMFQDSCDGSDVFFGSP